MTSLVEDYYLGEAWFRTNFNERSSQKDCWGLFYPPSGTVTAFNGLVATIKDHNDAKLKLKCITSREGRVEHVNRMVKGNFL
jgi:hypothetical protein